MRDDSVGLFWQELARETRALKAASGEKKPRAQKVIVRDIPVPDTGWTAPRELPNLWHVDEFAIDTETEDPGLTRGSGPAAGYDGVLVGVSIATRDASWYFPLAHRGWLNMNPEHVISWLRDLAAVARQRVVVGHNVLYDLEFLAAEGVRFHRNTRFFDTSYAAAVLDGNRLSYSLDACAETWLGDKKEGDELYAWLARKFGGKPTRADQIARIVEAPPELAGPYAEKDAALPLRLKERMWKELVGEGLVDVARLEMRLIPLLLEMRLRGVRVDLAAAERARDGLRLQYSAALDRIRQASGIAPDVWAADSVAKVLARAGVAGIPKTAGGKDSIRQAWLEQQDHPVAKDIVAARKFDKAVGTFLDGYIFDKHRNGRIYTQFHPVRSDDSGAVSGRFSSSTPNLQNIPSRDPFLGPLVRSIFVPEEGQRWFRGDYSQIEYRLLASDARGPGADDVRAKYIEDPSTDYHDATRTIIKVKTGIQLERGPTKNINFGLAYGMQKKKLAAVLGLSDAQTEELFAAYHAGVPFVQTTFDYFARQAAVTGEVRTFYGRRRVFDMWEPRRYSGTRQDPLPHDEAAEKWGAAGIRRAFTHIALNHRLQGGSADLMKLAMAEAYENGVFEVIGVPMLTVHDELDWSADLNAEGHADACECLRATMEAERPGINVPLVVEVSSGDNWGECK